MYVSVCVATVNFIFRSIRFLINLQCKQTWHIVRLRNFKANDYNLTIPDDMTYATVTPSRKAVP